jgi:hypothetical protein
MADFGEKLRVLQFLVYNESDVHTANYGANYQVGGGFRSALPLCELVRA